YADKLRRREFGAAREWLAPDFAGHAWSLGIREERELPLAARKSVFDVSRAPVVGREGFLEGIAAHLGPWRRVEYVLWKVKGADFDAATLLWGKIRFKISILGVGADGGPRALVAWANARAVLADGRWRLDMFELSSL